MEGKNIVQFYTNWIHQFEALTDEKAGQLIKHIFRYVNDQNPETDDPVILASFAMIKAQLKKDLVAWKGISEQNKDKADKRWGRGKYAVVSQSMPEDTDRDRDRDRDKDRDKDIVKGKEKVSKKEGTKRFVPPSINELKDKFFEKIQSKDFADLEAEKFYDFYSSNGWKVGKNKMVSWPHSVNNWLRGKSFNNVKNKQTNLDETFREVGIDIVKGD